jgi:hypothetical protein
MSRFTVASNGDLTATLERVEKTITSKGGSFTGNTTQGQFSGVTPVGNVKGKYTVNANKDIEITITDKPFIAPMSIIENKIRDYFA